MDRNQEIEFFKTKVNLVSFVESFSFERDLKKSSRHNFVMKKDDETLIISINKASGHWQYFNSLDSNDKGSIIEFIQNRKSLNLGQVRKELRDFLNINHPVYSAPYENKKPLNKVNIKKIKAFIHHREICLSNDYLLSRLITEQTIQSNIFKGRILEGYKGAVIFPHFNEEGVSSYEVNNKDFKHFPEEGMKGLWLSRTPEFIQEIIFIESPIEGLSYYQYFKEPTNILLVSGSGNWSKEADKLIIKLIDKNPNSKIKAAFNNDKGGHLQYERLVTLLENKAPVIKFFPDQQGSDWNKKLRTK